MKQYEYAIEYEPKGIEYDVQIMAVPSYEAAMIVVKDLHRKDIGEVRIIRREVSDWKPIHQSGIPGGIEFGS